MEAVSIENDKIIYFCEKTGQISATKKEGMVEVEHDKELRLMNTTEQRHLIADLILKFKEKADSLIK